MSAPVVTVAQLREVLRYEPETGKLFWLNRPVSMFSNKTCGGAAALARGWNGKHAGTEALRQIDMHGYKRGNALGKVRKAHQVAWALHYGEWPTGNIDHINGDPADNRIVNLRCVSHAENCRNQKLRSTNTSGVMGVRLNKATGKWDAFIRANYRHVHLGRFATKDEAVAARKQAERSAGFHENHGRAA
jgi:hypothetical protein